jgi:hypothetical protein
LLAMVYMVVPLIHANEVLAEGTKDSESTVCDAKSEEFLGRMDQVQRSPLKKVSRLYSWTQPL